MRMNISGASVRNQAFSLVEMVIIVAVVGVLAAIGVSTLNDGAITGAREEKLRNDLRVLNSAVNTYQAFGGSLEGVNDPAVVLAKLKTTLSEEQRKMMPGLGGAFIDPDIELVLQSEKESSTDNLRMYWDSSAKRFTLSNQGGIGIKALKVNPFSTASAGSSSESDSPFPDDGASPGGEKNDGEVTMDSVGKTESRKTSLNYSKESSWIWDYSDGALATPPSPSQIPTATPVPDAPPVSLPVPVLKRGLSAPIFSIPSGNYPSFAFPLTTYLANPNPAGSSKLVYSIDFGTWTDYDSAAGITVPADSTIQAQAVPNDTSQWDPSVTSEETYTSYFSQLLPPVIDFSAPYFTDDKKGPIDTISVTINNPNSPSVSELIYQIVPIPGGQGPATVLQTYSGSFDVSKADYPDGFGVRSYAASLVDGYEDSSFSTRFATEVQGLFGGHLDLDTSTSLARVNNGSTDAHTHDITGKFGVNTINFFNIPESKQIEIAEGITNPSQRFKLLVVNGNLSPGLSVQMNYTQGGVTHNVDLPVYKYDDAAIENLPVFSLGGVTGTSKLEKLSLHMAQDVILQAGVIPTNTGDVKGNILGKQYEWRNGSLTIQAVAVDDSGRDAFSTDNTLSNGNHGAAASGLLWEAALFWHWDGDSYHERGNTFTPGQLQSILDELDDPEAAEAYLEAIRYAEERRIQIAEADAIAARAAATRARQIADDAEALAATTRIKADQDAAIAAPLIKVADDFKKIRDAAKKDAKEAQDAANDAATLAAQIAADPTSSSADIAAAQEAADDAAAAALQAQAEANAAESDYQIAKAPADDAKDLAKKSEDQAKKAAKDADEANQTASELELQAEDAENLLAELQRNYDELFGSGDDDGDDGDDD